MSFEALMRRVDTVALDRLSNATMVFGGVSARVVFDRPSASPFDGALSAEDYEVEAPHEPFCELANGDQVLIDGRRYLVRGDPVPTTDFGMLIIRVHTA